MRTLVLMSLLLMAGVVPTVRASGMSFLVAVDASGGVYTTYANYSTLQDCLIAAKATPKPAEGLHLECQDLGGRALASTPNSPRPWTPLPISRTPQGAVAMTWYLVRNTVIHYAPACGIRIPTCQSVDRTDHGFVGSYSSYDLCMTTLIQATTSPGVVAQEAQRLHLPREAIKSVTFNCTTENN